MTTESETVEQEELEKGGSLILSEAQALAIRSPEDMAMADAHLAKARAHVKMIEEAFRDSKAKAKQAHQAICDLEKRALTPALEVARVLNPKMTAWTLEQRRIQEAEQRRLEDQAAKDAERLAKKLEKKGDPDGAELARATPAPVAAPSRIPTGMASTLRSTWKAEVKDKLKFIRAVAAGKVSDGLVQIDQGAIDRLAKALGKDLTNHYPGLEAVEVHSTVGKAGR